MSTTFAITIDLGKSKQTKREHGCNVLLQLIDDNVGNIDHIIVLIYLFIYFSIWNLFGKILSMQ